MKSHYKLQTDNFYNYSFGVCWKTFYDPLDNNVLELPEEGTYKYYWFVAPRHVVKIKHNKYKYKVTHFILSKKVRR